MESNYEVAKLLNNGGLQSVSCKILFTGFLVEPSTLHPKTLNQFAAPGWGFNLGLGESEGFLL